VYWLLTENYVLNANSVLMHTDLFSNVSGLGLIHCGLGLGLEKKFGPRPRPRPHSSWPRIPGKKVEKRKPKKSKNTDMLTSIGEQLDLSEGIQGAPKNGAPDS